MSHFHVRHAAMNAGKSTQLIQVAFNYEEQGSEVVLFTAAVDDRAGVGKIASRLGVSRDARVFDRETVFGVELLGRPACVLVDEAQFLSDAQVRQLHRYAHVCGVPVICYALRTDFTGRPFEGSTALMTLADTLEEIKTICACKRKATMNVRVNAKGERVQDGPQIEIGGNARYRAVCGRCFYLG